MKKVFRYNIPIDDEIHKIGLTSRPLHVELGEDGRSVDMWAEHIDRVIPSELLFKVVGTGHDLPSGAHHIGTTARHEGLIWHLFEVTNQQDN